MEKWSRSSILIRRIFPCPKGFTLGTEFQKYGFPDFLRATIVAPLASIPVAILVDLLVLFPTNKIVSNPPEGFVRFINGAIFLIFYSLPTAYTSTAIFGAIGLAFANDAKYRLTIPIGAIAGIVCGAITGFGWILFLSRENFDFSVFTESFIVTIIFPISILSGLLVGVFFTKLITKGVFR